MLQTPNIRSLRRQLHSPAIKQHLIDRLLGLAHRDLFDVERRQIEDVLERPLNLRRRVRLDRVDRNVLGGDLPSRSDSLRSSVFSVKTTSASSHLRAIDACTRRLWTARSILLRETP
jgi:hypothetical protein